MRRTLLRLALHVRGPRHHGMARSPSTPLRKALGLPALTFYGIGTIIGAGIYSVIGAAAGVAGEALWASFALAASAALLTALSYCELATLFPRAGAEYVFVRSALPRRRWPAAAVGFLVALTGATTAATVAIAFGGYARVFVDVPAWAAAAALLVLATALNVAGVKLSSRVNIAFTLVEAAGLVLVIWAGARAPDFGRALAVLPGDPGWAWQGILVGSGLIFFVYTGFEGLANLSEETKRPERDLPLGVLISLGVTTLLYLLVALAVVALARPEDLAASDSPLAMAAGRAAPWLSTALAAIALFATANTALISFLVASRVLFGMARGAGTGREREERDAPRVFALTLPRRKTPWVAALALLAFAGALLPLGRVEVVASLSSLISLLVFFSVNLALIVLRRRQPSLARPFRVPLSIGWFPVLPALGALAAAALLLRFEPTVYLAALATVGLAVGVPALGRIGSRAKRGLSSPA